MTRSVEIPDEIVEAACRAHWDSRIEASGSGVSWDNYDPAHDGSMEPYRRSMRAALQAVLPYHKAAQAEVAEAIAVAMETYPGGDQIRTSLAALLARQIGGVS